MSEEATSQTNTQDVVTEPAAEKTVAQSLYNKTEGGAEKAEPEAETKAEAKEETDATDSKEEDKNDASDADAKAEEIDYSEVKAPKDSKLKDADMERIVSFSKEQGLSKEAAKELAKSQSELIASHEESQQANFKQESDKWAETAKNDAEIGGEKFIENIAKADRFLKRYGSEELRSLLDASKLGNHPEMIRAFSKAGAELQADNIVMDGKGAVAKKSIADRLYDNTETN